MKQRDAYTGPRWLNWMLAFAGAGFIFKVIVNLTMDNTTEWVYEPGLTCPHGEGPQSATPEEAKAG